MNNFNPQVDIVIVNFNTSIETANCIESILKSSFQNFHIIVVDNNSSDNSVDYLKAKYPKVTILVNNENRGYAAGVNRGLQHCLNLGVDYILVVNSDARISPDALSHLVDCMRRHPDAGIVTGKVYFFDLPNVIQTAGKESDPSWLIGPHIGHGQIDTGQFNEEKELEAADDVFWLMKIEMIKKVGYYDEDFFINYEESDYCFRARNIGYKIYYCPKAKLWHKVSVSAGGIASPFWLFHETRSKMIFMKKYLDNKRFKHYILLSGWNTFLSFFRYMRHLRIAHAKCCVLGYFGGLCYSISHYQGKISRSR